MKVFQKEIAAMGYKFQFITLAGFHNLNYSTFKLAEAYKENGMAAYSELQQKEFGAEKDGYSATKHQREVGVSYFDAVSMQLPKVNRLLLQWMIQLKRINFNSLN